ncbi:Flp family type IVb pilin [Stutzerimonas kirkiae]|uniref:Flp family type IVb pilin n=1 Tax=Stutzerimonas kirkiae TaxID=2211392 RepID=A0A4Q9R514_9GAMM|nr:Flp family type IVb pilin [Stutzerimonas kirkiae]TBU93535.1 Flp family type IVb pilin [Stutzerimonas kirkiae]TBV01741.1 Flp family type IVb pilin [Stutzerimonas kirkiae]TBV11072.1 Flp family type IVb pilin [Stutzerimonas kirkiae]
MRRLLNILKDDERGVSALEYAILAGILVVVIVTGVTNFKGDIETLFENAGTAITNAATESTPD